AGRFKKISASFYPPDSPNNPTPGLFALRHIAFLGAQPPAIKGLPDAKFADDGPHIEFQEEIVMPDKPPADEAGLQQREGELRKKEEALRAKEAAFAEREQVLRRQGLTLQVDQLVKEGKVLPAQREEVVQFMMALPEEVVQFQEGKSSTPGEWFARFLGQLPAQVAFGEMADGQIPGFSEVPNASGTRFDPQRLVLQRKAETLAKQQGISFSEAVQQLGG
ncbi:MAG: hypothetical protein HQM06_16735, partial [Magnetococcales bacterium]|nr:hypothetical protein [Magnetococcales bacterium]